MKTYAFALTKFGRVLSVEIGSFAKLQLDGRLNLYNAMLAARNRMQEESTIGYITFRANNFSYALDYADKIENFSLDKFLLLEKDSVTHYSGFLIYKF